jgi:predicted nucleic acid-binding protein
MSFYLDANVLVALFVSDARSAAADSWIDSDAGELCVSDFAKIEVSAVLSRQVRVKAMSEAAAREALADFDDWTARMTLPVETGPRDTSLADRLVRDFTTNLSGPDALHLALAANRDHRLVTFDMRLAAAARLRGLGVVTPGPDRAQ